MRGTGRAGFTLLEVLVAVTIVALLAVTIGPAMGSRLRQGQVGALATQFDGLRQALEEFHADVRRYPRALAMLTSQPLATNHDVCGGTIPAGLRADWRGPYVRQNIAGNIAVGDATVLDTLFRQPANTSGGPLGQILVVALEVDSAVAAELERRYDASYNLLAGNILWIPTASPTGILAYQFPIRGC